MLELPDALLCIFTNVWLPLSFQIDFKFTEQLILVIINTSAVKKTEVSFFFPLVSCPNHQHNNYIEHKAVYITILWFQEFSLSAGYESSKSYQFIEIKN